MNRTGTVDVYLENIKLLLHYIKNSMTTVYPLYKFDVDGTENRFLSAVLQARNRDFVLSYQDVAFNDTTDPNTLQVSQLFKTRQNDDYWLRSKL